MTRLRLLLSVLPCALAAPALAAVGDCPGWEDGFALERTDLNGYAYATFDDGSGPALYVGGFFASIAGEERIGVARWNGVAWLPLVGPGGQLPCGAYDLEVFDDGAGPALYACGSFWIEGEQADIARWDGSSWRGVGYGLNWNPRALAAFDDGTGPALYAAGSFTLASGPQTGLLRWDGSNWSAVPGAPSPLGEYACLAVHDDGTGPALFVGGASSGSRVRRWDGASWTSITYPQGGLDPRALCSFDDGNGARLYLGGKFDSVDGVPAANVARWDGTAWGPLGAGVDGPVLALEGYDDGAGPALFAGLEFEPVITTPASGIARWNGVAWSDLGGTDDTVRGLAVFDAGAGPELHLCGEFVRAGEIAAYGFGRWNGERLRGTGAGPKGQGIQGGVRALVSGAVGGGDAALYATGRFVAAGEVAASNVAMWTDGGWRRLGDGVYRNQISAAALQGVTDAAIFDDGGGAALYVGGVFDTAGDHPAQSIARWDGADWSAVGSGFTTVYALAVHDDGTGAALHASAQTTDQTLGVWRWDGTNWSPVGPAFDLPPAALVSYGGALHAGGDFTSIGLDLVERLARWDGSAWEEVGGGVSGPIWELEVHSAAGGAELVVTGQFPSAGGLPIGGLARWDGASWAGYGAGVGVIYALASVDDGAGAEPALYVAGLFESIAGLPADRIARWGETGWSSLIDGGIGLPGAFALAAHDDGSGPALFVGGLFQQAGGMSAANFAKYALCDAAGAPYCFGDGSGAACPCGNLGSAGHGCANSTGEGGLLSSAGSASVMTGDLALLAQDLSPNQPLLFFQGDAATDGGLGASFGDGLRCAGGGVVRLESALSSVAGAASSSVDIGQVGGVTPGDRRFYQAFLRDPQLGPCGAGFNATNGLRVDWTP